MLRAFACCIDATQIALLASQSLLPGIGAPCAPYTRVRGRRVFFSRDQFARGRCIAWRAPAPPAAIARKAFWTWPCSGDPGEQGGRKGGGGAGPFLSPG